MKQVETGCVRGDIYFNHYSYDEKKDRTYVIVSVRAYWAQPPLFQMNDNFRIVVKGSDAVFAMTNSSSSACYIRKDDKSNWFVYDIFRATYTSFDEVRYRIPVKLVCKDKKDSMIGAITVVYHGMASGKISLIEATACYDHQAFLPSIDFSFIGAITQLGSDSPIEILPTLELSGSFETKTIWCKVRRAELTSDGFESTLADIQRDQDESESSEPPPMADISALL